METDWKKKYEEALKLAQSYYGKGQNEFLDTLFSELAESEDERIRKWIASYIHRGVFNEEEHPKALRAIEWLEKQKEQDKCPEFCSGHCVGCERNEQKPILEVFGFKVGDAVRLKDGDGRKHIIKSFEEVEGLHGPNFYHVEFEDDSARDGIYPGEEYPNGYYTQMEKFEEGQKPAEWSDTDNIGWDEAFACVTRAEKAAKNEEELQNAVTAEKWLKEIKFKYYVHPVKQEWSEEDKKRIQRIYDFLWKNRKGDTDTIYQIERDANWLKSLRPQQKQEWTEEDKKRYISIRTVLEASEIIENEEYDADVDWLRDMVNSVKYHKPIWKPSEEQMEALKKVVYNRPIGSAEFSEIESLYNDLKKLM